MHTPWNAFNVWLYTHTHIHTHTYILSGQFVIVLITYCPHLPSGAVYLQFRHRVNIFGNALKHVLQKVIMCTKVLKGGYHVYQSIKG